MHHDHHLHDIKVHECAGGIEVLGRGFNNRALSDVCGDQFGEWTLLNTIDGTLGLYAFTLIETGIVALRQMTLQYRSSQ